MHFREYLQVLIRRLPLFLVTLGVCIFAASVYGWNYEPRFDGTVVMTFAIEDQQDTSDYKYSNFYAEQSALEFTRTISGWYKDPSFQDHVFRVADVDYDKQQTVASKIFGFFSTKRIERQNIQTTYSAKNDSDAKALASALKAVIEYRLETYNEISKSQYRLAYNTAWIDKTESPWGILLVGSIFFGVILALFLVYIFEYMTGVLTLTSQVTTSLGKVPFDVIHYNQGSDQRYFRMRMLEEKLFSSVLDLGVSKSLFNGMDIQYFVFPNDVPQIKTMKFPILVVIRLGETVERDLPRVKALLADKKWEYLIIQ